MPKNTDIRGKTYDSSKSNPVQNTGMLKGDAKETPAEKATNDTGSTGYVGSGVGAKSPLGAKPSWK